MTEIEQATYSGYAQLLLDIKNQIDEASSELTQIQQRKTDAYNVFITEVKSCTDFLEQTLSDAKTALQNNVDAAEHNAYLEQALNIKVAEFESSLDAIEQQHKAAADNLDMMISAASIKFENIITGLKESESQYLIALNRQRNIDTELAEKQARIDELDNRIENKSDEFISLIQSKQSELDEVNRQLLISQGQKDYYDLINVNFTKSMSAQRESIAEEWTNINKEKNEMRILGARLDRLWQEIYPNKAQP